MKVVILAGGGGARLWPLSRGSFPKQFLSGLGSQSSLLQKTVLRFFKQKTPLDILIVTNSEYFDVTLSQVETIHSALKSRILIEPSCKNTGPAILFAVRYLIDVEAVSPEEPILVVPSDHRIDPEKTFIDLLPLLPSLVDQQLIVTFGIPPDRAETGFGYLKIDKKNLKNKNISHHKVRQFIEKPPLKMAEAFLNDGRYFWNSGIFAFNAKTFLSQVEQYCEELQNGATLSYKELKQKYETFPSLSIDVILMERSPVLVLLPLFLNWSDLGSWDTVFDFMEKDVNFNVKVGNVHDIETTNSLIYGGKKLISTIGLDGIILIETDDALFIGKRGESQKVKALVEELKKKRSERRRGR